MTNPLKLLQNLYIAYKKDINKKKGEKIKINKNLQGLLMCHDHMNNYLRPKEHMIRWPGI